MKDFFRFFALQVVNYCVIDASNRWIAQGAVTLSVSSAALCAIVGFTLMKQIADGAKTRAAIAGYVAGGMAGTWLGIVISKAVTGV